MSLCRKLTAVAARTPSDSSPCGAGRITAPPFFGYTKNMAFLSSVTYGLFLLLIEGY